MTELALFLQERENYAKTPGDPMAWNEAMGRRVRLVVMAGLLHPKSRIECVRRFRSGISPEGPSER